MCLLKLIEYIYFRNVKMFHLNYLFILSVISRAQETTLTDEERGERLRKGFRLIKGRAAKMEKIFEPKDIGEAPYIEIFV